MPMSTKPQAFDPEAEAWAFQQWGAVRLGDVRLQRRAVRIGTRLATQPGASLPQQMADRAELVATYRLLDHAEVSHTALSQPHWEATRQRAGATELVLLVQDTTELDYTRYATHLSGLGPIGNGGGQGLLLHTTLAVVPQPRQVLGIAHQQVFLRVPHPRPTEKRRAKAERESRVWGEAVEAIGGPPTDRRWVVVADAASDVTGMLLSARQQGVDVNIRLAAERRLVDATGSETDLPTYLWPTVCGWEAQVGTWVDIPARGGRPARRAQVHLSWGPVHIRTPQPHAPLGLWVVRVWEVEPPADAEPLEWRLATSVAVNEAHEALERVQWYSDRWVVEDYHQCLKSGCAIEQRDLETADRLRRLLGFLALVALRLLQLRDAARLTPHAPATTVVEPLLVHLLAAHLKLDASALTVRAFWRGVAQLGGFLGRRRDGEPGWKTLWRGWLYLDTLVQGARLAAALPQPSPGS